MGAEETSLLHKPLKLGWGTCQTFTIMAFFVMLLNQAMRANLSVVIVAMVVQDNSTGSDQVGSECPFALGQNVSEEISVGQGGKLLWGPQDQGLVLGAFYYGVLFTMLPGGLLAERYGGKWVIFTSIVGSSVCTLLNPVIAELGAIGPFMAIKILQGLFQGPMHPALFAMISRWVAPAKRSQYVAFIWAGTHAGTVVTLPLCGYLADVYNWQTTFYVVGIAGLIFSVAWVSLCYDAPESHPRISDTELEALRATIHRVHSGKDLPFPPLKLILTSVPVLALILTTVCSAWGFHTLMTEIPTYLNNIQHIPLTANGFLSALPYLLKWLFSLAASWVADSLITSKKMSQAKTRKSMTAIGFVFPTVFLVALAFTGCDPTLAIVWLCLSVMINGAAMSGFNVNQLELSPNYAGTLRGICNTVSNICGFATPALVGYLTEGQQTLEAWKAVFLIASGIYATACLVFVVFGRTSVQSWNTFWMSQDDNEMRNT